MVEGLLGDQGYGGKIVLRKTGNPTDITEICGRGPKGRSRAQEQSFGYLRSINHCFQCTADGF